MILGCAVCSAQNHNDMADVPKESYFKKNWPRFVNYVGCKYVDKYIEQYINATPNVPQAKVSEYRNKELHNILKKQNIDTPITLDSLSALLKKHKWDDVDDKFVSKFKERLGADQNDLSVLLSLDLYTEKTKDWLKEEKNSLQKEISEYVLNQKDLESVNNKTNRRDVVPESNESNTRNKASVSLFNWWLITLTVCVTLLFVAIIVLFKIKANQSLLAEIQRKLDDSRCSDSNNQYTRLSMDINNLKDDMFKLKAELNLLKSRNIEDSRSSNSRMNNTSSYKAHNDVSQPVATSAPQNSQQINNESQKEYIYLRPFKEGVLKESSRNNSEALFRIVHMNGEDYRFEFDQTQDKVETALNSVDAYFGGICDMEGYSSSSRRVTMLQTGVVRKQQNGSWIVMQKGRVKFE